MRGCLDGVRVLELARYQAGPQCGSMLGELGAEVIKVERIGGEETRANPPIHNGQSIYFAVYNRGKKSITLDLESERGKELLRKLVKVSDVVLENFRPGIMEKMGFGFDVLKSINPRIILTRASAGGQYGPYRHRPGFDPLGQAMSGLMYLTGRSSGSPVRTASSVIDRVTALHATIGTLAALLETKVSGRGQVVDVCLMDTGFRLTEIPLSQYWATHKEPEPGGQTSIQCKDGSVVIVAVTPPQWSRLFSTIGRPELANDKTFTDASAQNRRLRDDAISQWAIARTVKEVLRSLEDADVPVAPVNTIAQAAQDPHLREREVLVEVEDAGGGKVLVPGLTIKLSETPGRLGKVPKVGEHNDEVLSTILGLSREEIAGLRTEGVV